MHARASGLNLVCCDIRHPVIDSCEFSALCNSEHCECHLNVGSELSCDLEEVKDSADFVWRDHHQHWNLMSCFNLNLPNRGHPYKVTIQNWNKTLTPNLVMGLAGTNVTQLRIYDIDETTLLVDLAKYTPHLRSLEFSTKTRRHIDVFSTFRHLTLLENLRIVNVDVNFSRAISPWVHTITHIHIENSSLRELPSWLAMSDNLNALTVKSTGLNSLSTISQLRGLRSARLPGNALKDLAKHVFLSKDIYDIDLSRNTIKSFAAHTFALCTELRVLDLSQNPLELLPHRAFFRNTKLKWIKLSGTKITKIEPGHFVGLAALKSLALSYSPLLSIHPFAFVPLKSLRTLDLEGVNISAIPSAITQNCKLTFLNVAHNMLNSQSSLPPEVISMMSSLSQLKIDGNPLNEFPPSVFLLSTDNFRLIRQIFQTMISLPLWTVEPCTPYYWAMHLRNRSSPFRQLVSIWSEDRMERDGLSYCRKQYEWMIEDMEAYRDFEKNSGCSVNRKFRSAVLATKSVLKCATNFTPQKTQGKVAVIENYQDLFNFLLASLAANAILFFLVSSIVCVVLCYGNKKLY